MKKQALEGSFTIIMIIILAIILWPKNKDYNE